MNCVQDLKLKPWDGSPARVVGRYRNNAGRLTDGIFLGDGVLPIGKRLDLAQLAQDTRDFAEKFPRHTATPLAIVGVAFGAPFSRDLNYRLWKGDWVEQDHPREPDGTPQGGEFAPKDGQVSDEAANGATGLGDQSDNDLQRPQRENAKADRSEGSEESARCSSQDYPWNRCRCDSRGRRDC